ncbi:hypothetical protein C2G38_2217963 [Gigaspora rosea]|uniref:Uncharacterized protein n=1 Tax=Gigaspora rosea TaxID=44941 RepID=A0A397UBE7_9GLOM|nr:hypothetical protein C2G38_2217963 [Gigaspora rosea]
MKRYKEAIIDLTKLLNIEPNNKFALRYLEDIYHLTKEAIIDLAKLLVEDLENLLETKQDTALKSQVKFILS